MTSTIDAEETTLSELLEVLKSGDSIIITSGPEKTPVATLARISEIPKNPKRLGFLEHLHLPPIPDSAFFDSLPEEELALWEGEDA